jgi:hypothetical protein
VPEKLLIKALGKVSIEVQAKIIEAIVKTGGKISETTLIHVLKQGYTYDREKVKLILDAIYLTYGAFSIETLKLYLQAPLVDTQLLEEAFGAYFRAGGKIEELTKEIKSLAKANGVDEGKITAIKNKVSKQEIVSIIKYTGLMMFKSIGHHLSANPNLERHLRDFIATNYGVAKISDFFEEEKNKTLLPPLAQMSIEQINQQAVIKIAEIKGLIKLLQEDINPKGDALPLLSRLIITIDDSYDDVSVVKAAQDIAYWAKSIAEEPALKDESPKTRITRDYYRQLINKLEELEKFEKEYNSRQNNNNNAQTLPALRR